MNNNKKKRILIKLSGESLMGDDLYGIELKTVEKLAKNIKSLIKLNTALSQSSEVFMNSKSSINIAPKESKFERISVEVTLLSLKEN